ncbi:MAG: hypothetical protein E3J96_05975 [Sulfurovum sp.]|nr:MAG: hypothetical protein E3J96_05975 [Sulfurovum sp.]
MRSPRGFGKNYFTFSAILAYSVEHKLQSQVASVQSLFRLSDSSEPLDENDPPDELLETTLLQDKKPCHCNCYFKLKTRMKLLLHHYIPRCPFYCTYFAFRRTGVHPPLI